MLAATGARELESAENLGGPLVQYIDLIPCRVGNVALVLQRQVPTIQTVKKTVEVLETQHFDGAVDVTVVLQRQVPTIRSVQKTIEVPETQCLDGMACATAVSQRQVSAILLAHSAFGK